MTTTHTDSIDVVIINSVAISTEAISLAIQTCHQVSASAIRILTNTDEVDEWLASGNVNPDSSKPQLVVIGGDFTFTRDLVNARA